MAAIENLTRALEQIPSVRLAVLFGSAARGSSRADSDIDLGVSLERESDFSPTPRCVQPWACAIGLHMATRC